MNSPSPIQDRAFICTACKERKTKDELCGHDGFCTTCAPKECIWCIGRVPPQTLVDLPTATKSSGCSRCGDFFEAALTDDEVEHVAKGLHRHAVENACVDDPIARCPAWNDLGPEDRSEYRATARVAILLVRGTPRAY